MNKAKIIELLTDGAVFDTAEQKLYHPSFRKGWRKMATSDISWQAVNREHGCTGTERLQEITRRVTLKPIADKPHEAETIHEFYKRYLCVLRLKGEPSCN